MYICIILPISLWHYKAKVVKTELFVLSLSFVKLSIVPVGPNGMMLQISSHIPNLEVPFPHHQ